MSLNLVRLRHEVLNVAEILDLLAAAEKVLTAEPVWWCEVHRCEGIEKACPHQVRLDRPECQMQKVRIISDDLAPQESLVGDL